jgi:hypothetical protein
MDTAACILADAAAAAGMKQEYPEQDYLETSRPEKRHKAYEVRRV